MSGRVYGTGNYYWTERSIEKLKFFVEKGLSGGQIAMQMGLTRGIVLSKIRRMNLRLARSKR